MQSNDIGMCILLRRKILTTKIKDENEKCEWPHCRPDSKLDKCEDCTDIMWQERKNFLNQDIFSRLRKTSRMIDFTKNNGD